MAEFKYTALITGIHAPYAWVIKVNKQPVTAGKDERGETVPVSGNADSYEEAIEAAVAAARCADESRRQAKTVRTVELFSTLEGEMDPEKVRASIDAEVGDVFDRDPQPTSPTSPVPPAWPDWAI